MSKATEMVLYRTCKRMIERGSPMVWRRRSIFLRRRQTDR